MNGAHGIVSMLKAAGVERVFGVGGESVLALMDAIRTDDDVEYTPVRHEQAAALAASGYARIHRQPVACLGHIGAGATNLVNGVADAYKDSNPVIAITADAETEKAGRDAWHELDQETLFAPVTDEQVRLDRVERIPQRLRDTLTTLNTGSPGPIHVDVAIDVASDPVDDDTAEAIERACDAIPPFMDEHARVQPSEQQLVEAVSRFEEAERPLVLAGGGVLWSGASDALEALVDYTGVPVVTTLNGRGALSEYHDRCFGAIGTFGRTSAEMIADEADVVFALGTRLGDNETFGWSIYEDAELVHVDLDEANLGKQYETELIRADVSAFLEQFDAQLRETIEESAAGWELSKARETMDAEIEAVTDPAEEDRADTDAGLVNPHEVLRVVSEAKEPEDVVCSGAGQHSLWANLLPVERPNTYGKSVGLGTMGYALNAGIGAQVGADDRTVFVLVGDGDVVMVCQEFGTCVQESLPIVVVVFNDEQYSAIKNPQQRRFDGPPFGTDYPEDDFAAIAEGFGATGIRVESGSELDDAMAEALAGDGPAVLDVKIDPEVQAPSFFYENQ